MVQKDIKLLGERMDLEFGRIKDYMDHRFESIEKRFATKEDLAALRSDLSKTIYFTSLGQLFAIIASVISLVLILKK